MAKDFILLVTLNRAKPQKRTQSVFAAWRSALMYLVDGLSVN